MHQNPNNELIRSSDEGYVERPSTTKAIPITTNAAPNMTRRVTFSSDRKNTMLKTIAIKGVVAAMGVTTTTGDRSKAKKRNRTPIDENIPEITINIWACRGDFRSLGRSFNPTINIPIIPKKIPVTAATCGSA